MAESTTVCLNKLNEVACLKHCEMLTSKLWHGTVCRPAERSGQGADVQGPGGWPAIQYLVQPNMISVEAWVVMAWGAKLRHCAPYTCGYQYNRDYIRSGRKVLTSKNGFCLYILLILHNVL